MKKSEYQNIFNLEEKHWWYSGMKKISFLLLSPVFERGNLKILDAGCGTGGMMMSLGKWCRTHRMSIGQVYGIDLSQEAIKFCQKRNLEVIQASIEKIPFKDNSFDLITCFDVLYHQWVKNDQLAIREFFRTLKSGGFLFLRVPAYQFLTGKHDEVVATRHRYSKAELLEKLEGEGFKIKRTTFANMFLFPVALIKRFLEKRMVKEATSEIKEELKIVNQSLKGILSLEAFLISKINLPFGLSIFCLAQKPRSQAKKA